MTGGTPLIALFTLFALAGCTLPGRQTLAPNPAGADTASISATQAFAGRIPLVTILPGTTDFAAPLAKAVAQARAIKPGVMFDVEAQAPVATGPDTGATTLNDLDDTAKMVAAAIIADGVAPDHVSRSAKTAGLNAGVDVYVK
ncbi:MAG: hypothetical protein POH28_06270 [Acidocella sp.]|nr:hypothetical protein [Acidocella sp.]